MRNESTNTSGVVERAVTSAISGQLLRLSDHHEVAIYLRDGAVCIADFIDGQGALVDVTAWFRFNCGSPANAYLMRRMAIEAAKPLSEKLIARIEALHRPIIAERNRKLHRVLARLAALLPRRHAATQTARRFHRRSSLQAPPAP